MIDAYRVVLHTDIVDLVLVHLTVMTILTHGADITLAPGIKPLIQKSGNTLSKVASTLREAGFISVQLDVTLSGLRPRELDARARKDLAALLGRRGVGLAGLDLFIPRKHYLDAKHIDRAVSSTVAAIQLAADLGKVPVSIALPTDTIEPSAASAILEAADGHGVRLAVHAEDHIRKLIDWVDSIDLPILGVGIDPAALIAEGINPVNLVHRLGKRLAVARLSDAKLTGSGQQDHGVARCLIGDGELDIGSYRIALDLAITRTGPVILDLHSLSAPAEAAGIAKTQWDDAAFTA